MRVFIASPGDVAEERDIASHVVGELNRVFAGSLGVELEAVRWETHASPDVGVDAQDVVTRQIGDFDVLVGIMWRRFGTPTRRSRSGTGEEFERAYLTQLLRRTSGNVTRAAQLAGKERRALGKLLKRYGIAYVADSGDSPR